MEVSTLPIFSMHLCFDVHICSGLTLLTTMMTTILELLLSILLQTVKVISNATVSSFHVLVSHEVIKVLLFHNLPCH